IMLFVIGNVVAFIVALIAVKTFISVLTKYGFKPWGWYRIIIGIILLFYFWNNPTQVEKDNAASIETTMIQHK
ncbi:MAG: undecaprenyl-diphosphate phosphatase, partial [Algoriella sp.]